MKLPYPFLNPNLVLKILLLICLHFYCSILKSQELEDSFSINVPIFDTLSINFDMSLYDVEMNLRALEKYEQKRITTLRKLPELKPYYSTVPKQFAVIDSALTVVDNLYEECEHYLKQLLMDKQTFYFTIRYKKQTGVFVIPKSNPDEKRPLPFNTQTSKWQIDTVIYNLPALANNSPFEFLIKEDSVSQKPNMFLLYFSAYRKGFTQPKNTYYKVKVKDKKLRLKHLSDTCSLTPSNFCVRITPDDILLYAHEDAVSYVRNDGVPNNAMAWWHCNTGVLHKRTNPFLLFLKNRKWSKTEPYKIPILVAGRSLVHFQRLWNAKFAEEFAQMSKK